MNLRVRRVQEVFDILATTLWVVTAPRKEGGQARLRGPLLVLVFLAPALLSFFPGSDRIDELSPVILPFPPYKSCETQVGCNWPCLAVVSDFTWDRRGVPHHGASTA